MRHDDLLEAIDPRSPRLRAVIADSAGPPGVLHPIDLPDPEPGPGQVRVAVGRSAISFIDTQLRAGSPIGPPVEFPAIFGNGVGGRIDAIGTDVEPAWLGTTVVTSTGGRGGYASLAIANVTDLHRVPDGIDVTSALALLGDGRTALGLARAAEISRGDTVVVTAAAGGVGGLLVQLAVRAGARVIALAGDPTKLDHVAGLGADVVINYRLLGWVEAVAVEAPSGPDVVFDGVGGFTTSMLYPMARSGSRYLVHGGASGRWASIDSEDAQARDVTVVPLSAIAATSGEYFSLTEDALAMAANGDLHATIGQTYPLDRAADAHAAIEDRLTIGKTLLLT